MDGPLNLPNLLALARIVMTPFVMLFVLLSDQMDHAFGIALAIFIPAALTDFADGYLARRWKITTVLGAFLDSVADKILVVGSLLVLIEVGRVNNLSNARYGQEHSHADSGADRYSSAHPHLPELCQHLSAGLAHCCC